MAATEVVNPNYKLAESVYEFSVRDLSGRDVKLEKYRGHVLLVVNVASECGLTDTNYKQLNQLHQLYADTKGLRILAFPCNQFNSQEPGTSEDITNFAAERKVKFDIFEKLDVNGDHTHPLYKFLKLKQGGPLGDFIKWNYTKFITDIHGVPLERHNLPTALPLNLIPNLEKYFPPDKVEETGMVLRKGTNMHFYSEHKQGGTLGNFLKWNFTKFIVDKNGMPVERHGPNVDPLDLVPNLEKYWAQEEKQEL